MLPDRVACLLLWSEVSVCSEMARRCGCVVGKRSITYNTVGGLGNLFPCLVYCLHGWIR